MCGLVGIFDTTGKREIPHAVLQRMNNTLIHRGPDGEGFHVEPGLGLGHRRLAIIDIEGGHQPMWSPTLRKRLRTIRGRANHACQPASAGT